jgi:hypothetical protein
MNTPRENDPNELDRFKRDIDLVDYAQRHGYQVEKEGKQGNWHQLKKDDEMLIVTRKGDHQVYLNPGDDRDKGSVVDFAKTRGAEGHGLNLGQVRQELRQYLDGNPAPPREYAQPVDVAKLNALPVGPEQERQAQEERKTRLISEVLGVNKELTDRSYLHSRGIEDKTIDAPAFQGRIFTAQQNEHKNTAFPLYNEQGLASVEQKNNDYKNLLAVPKNGVWVSHPTEGKDTPVARVVVSESAIDSLSHYQLKSEQEKKNTIYIATSGTPTEAQVALIQRVIDKQAPKEVVLANDRDAGGRQFNINYLNELQPARALTPVAGQEAYKEATRPVEWHATSDKYHASMKVTMHHESAAQGAPQVEKLTEQVNRMNSTQPEPSIQTEVLRSTERETVIRLSVAKSDLVQLEVVGQELYRQREQLRPPQERQAEPFLRVEYATAKDWNRELELVKAGMNPEQIKAQAALDEQQREAQRQQRETERAQREAEARAAANTPEAREKRAQEDKAITQAIVAVAVAENTSPAARAGVAGREANDPTPRPAQEAAAETSRPPVATDPRPETTPPPKPEQIIERPTASVEQAPVIPQPQQQQGSEKQVIIKVDEVAPREGQRGQAEAVKEAIGSSGARTGDIQSTVDSQGIRHSEMKVSYNSAQPDIAKVSNTLDAVAKQSGNQVIEHGSDRAERQQKAESQQTIIPARSRDQEISR